MTPTNLPAGPESDVPSRPREPRSSGSATNRGRVRALIEHLGAPLRLLHPAVRLALVPGATILGWAGCLSAAHAVGGVIATLLSASVLNRLMDLDYRAAIVGACAAVGWVLGGSIFAPPRHRWWVSTVLYGLGVAAAWTLLRDWSFPENHPRGYQFTNVPLYGTWLGGLLALVGVWLWALKDSRRERPARQDFMPT